jgi:hypothetical protein
MRWFALSFLAACHSADVSDLGHPADQETGTSPKATVTLGPTLVLSVSQDGTLHHHATVAWAGDEDTFCAAFVTGNIPVTHALAVVYDHDGNQIATPVELAANLPTPYADKPDVEWDGSRYVIGFENGVGNVFLDAVDDVGFRLGEPRLLAVSNLLVPTLASEAVDLAVQPDGTGIAMWTESGAPWMGLDDGRIAWRAFDADLGAVGPDRIAIESSRKTSDAAPMLDGGWVGVWAIHYDHPTDPNEVYYEVWGRLHRGDGVTGSFRADDLDAQWPSRPAVAVSDEGLLSISFRNKTSSNGDSAGTFGRLFDADAMPYGPSFEVSSGGDGDRIVTAWADDVALYSWQEVDTDGLSGIWLSAVYAPTGEIIVDRMPIHDPADLSEERPSFAVRRVAPGVFEIVYVWETFRNLVPNGIQGRVGRPPLEDGLERAADLRLERRVVAGETELVAHVPPRGQDQPVAVEHRAVEIEQDGVVATRHGQAPVLSVSRRARRRHGAPAGSGRRSIHDDPEPDDAHGARSGRGRHPRGAGHGRHARHPRPVGFHPPLVLLALADC